MLLFLYRYWRREWRFNTTASGIRTPGTRKLTMRLRSDNQWQARSVGTLTYRSSLLTLPHRYCATTGSKQTVVLLLCDACLYVVWSLNCDCVYGHSTYRPSSPLCVSGVSICVCICCLWARKPIQYILLLLLVWAHKVQHEYNISYFDWNDNSFWMPCLAKRLLVN